MTKIKNIIFDFDGTLVDTQDDIITSFNEAINKIKGTYIDSSTLRIGPPLEEMINSFFPTIAKDEVIEIVSTFRNTYSECGFNKTNCYNGIYDLLLLLKEKKLSIYIATNKPEYLTRKIINKLDLDFFESICTIDSIQGRTLSKKEMVSLLIEKNKFERSATIMIGDSASDINAAFENQILSIGVGYGYESEEKIMQSKPGYFFDSVNQLTNFIKNII